MRFAPAAVVAQHKTGQILGRWAFRLSIDVLISPLDHRPDVAFCVLLLLVTARLPADAVSFFGISDLRCLSPFFGQRFALNVSISNATPATGT